MEPDLQLPWWLHSSTLSHHSTPPSFIRTRGILDHSTLRDEHFANCETEPNTAQSEVLQAKNDNVHNMAGAVHLKPCTSRKIQIDENICRKQEVFVPLKKNWSEETAKSAKYHPYKTPFIEMLLQFQPMGDGHYGCINVSKHLIRLFQIETAPEQSALNRVHPKIRELEKAKNNETLANNIINSAQIGWVAPIVFVSKKVGAVRFSVH